MKTYRLKVKEWRKLSHVNTNQKKAGGAPLIQTAHFRARKVMQQRGVLHNDKRVTSPRRYNSP